MHPFEFRPQHISMIYKVITQNKLLPSVSESVKDSWSAGLELLLLLLLLLLLFLLLLSRDDGWVGGLLLDKFQEVRDLSTTLHNRMNMTCNTSTSTC